MDTLAGLLGPVKAKLSGLLDYAPDAQFYADIGNRLSGLLSTGVQDVFPAQPFQNAYDRARAGEKNVLSTEWEQNSQMRDAALNTALAAMTVNTGKPSNVEYARQKMVDAEDAWAAYWKQFDRPGSWEPGSFETGVSPYSANTSQEKDLLRSNLDRAKRELAKAMK